MIPLMTLSKLFLNATKSCARTFTRHVGSPNHCHIWKGEVEVTVGIAVGAIIWHGYSLLA